MSPSPRCIFPSFVIASEIAILAFTTYLIAINYSAYHNDRSLEPASDDASVLSWIQLSSTPSILRLLYGCLCGDLENLPVALYAAGFAWAGLTMLCTRFSTPATLHSGHAHLIAIDAAIGTFFLVAVFLCRPAATTAPVANGELKLGEKLGEPIEQQPTRKSNLSAYLVREVVACWNSFRFMYMEFKLVLAGWGAIHDQSIVDGLFWGQTIGFAIDALLALGIIVQALHALVQAFRTKTVSLFDASGYALIGDVTATIRYVLDFICICVLAAGPLTGTMLHVSQYASLVSMLLPAWCVIGTINMFSCSGMVMEADEEDEEKEEAERPWLVTVFVDEKKREGDVIIV
ncbi:unnamed protein product [Clonostachys byssicola]|uniref:Uncharacterized protein n=1 Tax=Clonostachys byssicola TaxID=160290 RepID=A0A9N9XXM0_9HYPO|nr:unnamed protein product [Clonostachys byssicola]